jgi:hypothetical protein
MPGRAMGRCVAELYTLRFLFLIFYFSYRTVNNGQRLSFKSSMNSSQMTVVRIPYYIVFPILTVLIVFLDLLPPA